MLVVVWVVVCCRGCVLLFVWLCVLAVVVCMLMFYVVWLCVCVCDCGCVCLRVWLVVSVFGLSLCVRGCVFVCGGGV